MKGTNVNRTDLNKRIAALAGAVTLASGLGALLPASATAADGKIKIDDGRETMTYALESGPCTRGDVGSDGKAKIHNETDKPLKVYESTDCSGTAITVAPGDTKEVSGEVNYGFSFIAPGYPQRRYQN